MSEINGIKVPFRPIVENDRLPGKKIREFESSFESVFKKELEKVKFSNHAMKRLESRNILFSENEIEKLNEAVTRAEMKGARDTLVVLNDNALIINVPNKTVVTAMQVDGGDENVFTNIDSVVFTK